MPTITGPQLLALAIQFNAMARELNRKHLINPDPALKSRAQNLLNAASDLSTSAILATLDSLAVHYEGILLTVRELNREIAFQQHVAKVLALADAALAVAAAALKGDPLSIATAISNTIALLP